MVNEDNTRVVTASLSEDRTLIGIKLHQTRSGIVIWHKEEAADSDCRIVNPTFSVDGKLLCVYYDNLNAVEVLDAQAGFRVAIYSIPKTKITKSLSLAVSGSGKRIAVATTPQVTVGVLLGGICTPQVHAPFVIITTVLLDPAMTYTSDDRYLVVIGKPHPPWGGADRMQVCIYDAISSSLLRQFGVGEYGNADVYLETPLYTVRFESEPCVCVHFTYPSRPTTSRFVVFSAERRAVFTHSDTRMVHSRVSGDLLILRSDCSVWRWNDQSREPNCLGRIETVDLPHLEGVKGLADMNGSIVLVMEDGKFRLVLLTNHVKVMDRWV
jgi:hypothetical protein